MFVLFLASLKARHPHVHVTSFQAVYHALSTIYSVYRQGVFVLLCYLSASFDIPPRFFEEADQNHVLVVSAGAQVWQLFFWVANVLVCFFLRLAAKITFPPCPFRL